MERPPSASVGSEHGGQAGGATHGRVDGGAEALLLAPERGRHLCPAEAGVEQFPAEDLRVLRGRHHQQDVVVLAALGAVDRQRPGAADLGEAHRTDGAVAVNPLQPLAMRRI